LLKNRNESVLDEQCLEPLLVEFGCRMKNIDLIAPIEIVRPIVPYVFCIFYYIFCFFPRFQPIIFFHGRSETDTLEMIDNRPFHVSVGAFNDYIINVVLF